MDLRQLEQEISSRLKDREGIRERVQKYAFSKFGIVDLYAIIHEALGEPEGFEVCLARQIPAANVEHAAVGVFSAWLTRHMDYKVTGRFLSFSRDTYFPNPYKRSLVRLPQLKRGRKGPFLHYEKVASPCQGQILSLISTQEGVLLPGFHETLRSVAFSREKVSDLSGFLQNLAKSTSKNGPSCVYLRNGDKEKKSFSFDLKDDVRPPAEWYYLPYLLLFMDGRRGLLTIIGNQSGVNKLIVNSVNEIKREIGIEPLLIPVLGQIPWLFEPRGEYIFPEAIKKRDWESDIKISSSSNLYKVYEDIEYQILRLV